ncbi:MAG: helix-turn-helix domain-containing protein [Anaerolineae bacterium]
MLEIGEKLRTARRSQGLSLRELAARAEVSASLLSQIENGKANPSVRSLHSIADALSLPIDYFFPDRSSEEATGPWTASDLRAAQVAALREDAAPGFDEQEQSLPGPALRADARSTIELRGGVTWARLTPGQEAGIEFLQVVYDVGADSGVKMSHHIGREFGLVLEGELTVELGFERYVLCPGDSIIFDSTTPHRLVNAGQAPVRAIWVVFDTVSK